MPGTLLRWSDIFRAGAAFPNNKSVLVPRLWWCEGTNIKDAIRNDLKQLNGLLPDSLQLLNSPKRGATERGEKWEELRLEQRCQCPALLLLPTHRWPGLQKAENHQVALKGICEKPLMWLWVNKMEPW